MILFIKCQKNRESGETDEEEDDDELKLSDEIAIFETSFLKLLYDELKKTYKGE